MAAHILFLLATCLPQNPECVTTAFVQVAPSPGNTYSTVLFRSPSQQRAVVLIHGFYLQTISAALARQADFHGWQKPNSVLVRTLCGHADVFAFAYSQDYSIDCVANSPELALGIESLRRLGYSEIVLVAHSAGGLIARQFVEDHPHAGVTKVIQICAPNNGAGIADAGFAVRAVQRPFVESMGRDVCRRNQWNRRDVHIPPHVEFVCIVCTGAGLGDGLISRSSQWSEELQAQGIPAYTLKSLHFHCVRTHRGAELIAELIRSPQGRWTECEVAAARRRVLGH